MKKFVVSATVNSPAAFGGREHGGIEFSTLQAQVTSGIAAEYMNIQNTPGNLTFVQTLLCFFATIT